MPNALHCAGAPLAPNHVSADMPDQRDAQRFTLLIRAAKLVTRAGEYLCVIRDVSESGISVRIFHPLPVHGAMEVELQNGDRHQVELVWQEEERAGFRFANAADIERMIQSPSRFNKRAIRLNVSVAAEVTTREGMVEQVEITDISQQGAKISCSCRFAIDGRVTISAEGLPETEAKVRWRRDGTCGLIFEDTYQYGDFARIAHMLQPFSDGLRQV